METHEVALNVPGPVVRYQEANGYYVNETSVWWKNLCSVLPCSLALQWPGYSTKIVEDVIDGQPVVIQLWKGWCPKFLGLDTFPGGMGAEVGIYRRIPGRARPISFPFLPDGLASRLLTVLATAVDEDLWWPFPELGARITFQLRNPASGATFFSAGPENSYWVAKWMEDESYRDYAGHLGAPAPSLYPWYPPCDAVPSEPDGYQLDFTINGNGYPAWGGDYVDRQSTIVGPLSLLIL